jgi:hypothetical protein
MGKHKNNIIMRKILFSILFLLITAASSAPITDFRLKMETIRIVSAQLDVKYHESEFTRFINDLGYRESLNNWVCINRIGCFGEWQFAESTLKYLGFRKVTLRKFKSDPFIFPRKMQEDALRALIRVNLTYLSSYEKYIGKTIKGITVTKSGMIAASHLGGAGSLKRFLESGGKTDHKDAFGTAVSNYLKKFSNYDIEQKLI